MFASIKKPLCTPNFMLLTQSAQFISNSAHNRLTITSTGRLGGEGVEESQDLDAKVGILGQNQSNALRKHILLMLITEHEEKNVPQ